MKFGEKIKILRKEQGMTQLDLAKTVGVSLRTITAYESDGVYPRRADMYEKLAEVLHTTTAELRSEEDLFISQANEKYGKRASAQAKKLMEQVNGLFAGGDLADEDMDEMMQAIQEAYWIAKKNNRKYVPKKYRQSEESH